MPTTKEPYYITLHQDIKLKQKTNGLWDYTITDNDYETSTGLDSLYNACILAVLTAYNEIGRHQIPIYNGFGNRSYELLKKNKDNLTQHKIESYFKNCLENIRRVADVEELTVTENNKNLLYNYTVYFRVRSITNEIITETINLNNYKQTPTTLESGIVTPITTQKDNNQFTFTLTDKYGQKIPYQVINLYINNEIVDREITDINGNASFTVPIPHDQFHLYLTASSESTTPYSSSTTNTDTVIALFHFHINEKGELIYNYYSDYLYPDFMLNEDGELLMEYNTDEIQFKDIKINEQGFLIMNT